MKEIKAGNYVLSLAYTEEELLNIYKLRYNDLILDYNVNTKEKDIDKDEYDNSCDYLIVKDTKTNEIIGTYRLIQRKHLKSNTFPSESEYNIDNLKKSKYNILEVSRAVVHKLHRDGLVIKLLLKGIFEYCKENNIRYVFGTASFHGNDVNKYEALFSYLFNNYLTNNDLKAIAKEDSTQKINSINNNLSEVEVFRNLPPLVKTYLKMGASIGEGIYIDVPFNSIDVFVLLDLENKNERYVDRLLAL